ncbi:phosphopantetheine-binding protein [Streptomyces sp. NPDC093586]|uniref:phosphopantetheine-binding protein n=1 Tax=Streptomyces sp. NPDC093586 TaxID=3366042 RepID=UPI0037F8ACB1
MDEHSVPDVLETVRTSIVTVVPEIGPAEVTREASMADLGCNSIDRAEVIALTLEQLGISVPVADFQGLPDIGSLVDLLRKHL